MHVSTLSRAARFALVAGAALLLLLVIPVRSRASGGYTVVETLTVPTNGGSVTSSTILSPGVTYELKASGTFHIGCGDDTGADAEYADCPGYGPIDNCNADPAGTDLGIGVDDSDVSRAGRKQPFWGPFDPSHVYTIDWVGAGAAISLNYHDCFIPDNAGVLTVEILAPQPTDTTPPSIAIATPANGAVYATGQSVIADYSCSDADSGVASCSGPVADGSPVDTSNGVHSFTVSAQDVAGNPSSSTVTYTAASRLAAGSTTCNGWFTGTGKDVSVPAGAVCHLLAGSSVSHDLVVQPGGLLVADQIDVGHDLKIAGGGGSRVCGSRVGHDLTLESGSGAPILIGDGANGCAAGNSVDHDLVVQGNADQVDVGNNGVGHDLKVQDNKPGGATVRQNTAGHDAVCQGNSPQAGSGNTAAHGSSCPV